MREAYKMIQPEKVEREREMLLSFSGNAQIGPSSKSDAQVVQDSVLLLKLVSSIAIGGSSEYCRSCNLLCKQIRAMSQLLQNLPHPPIMMPLRLVH